MAAVRFLLGIICVITLSWSWNTLGNDLESVNDQRTKKANALIDCARKEIGVREESCNNCGKAVKEYLSYTGINTPAPWCAAWVSFVFGKIGYTAPKTAWSPSLFPANRMARDALPGHVFGIYFPSLKRIAHCGIVETVKGNWIYAIEGNTNIEGSREGDGVYRRLRHKRTIAKYAEWL